VSDQKVTKENMDAQQEQQKIHSSLNALLTQIMVCEISFVIFPEIKRSSFFTMNCRLQSEYERKEEELELRRQELHRVREQNHGYQERLQSRTSTGGKVERCPSPSPGGLSSPTLSPPRSRPSSFLSSSSDPPHPEEEQGM
jgi:FtsZ-binding cell division protein ZapB